MSTISETSDDQLVALLRRRGPMSVTELASQNRVTATAVRQRLARLMSQGLVQREVQRGVRGRPSHRYSLTERAQRRAGSNFADLAVVLWNEIRNVKDVVVRRGLLERLADALGRLYAGEFHGKGLESRMDALQRLFAQRDVPIELSSESSQPVLTVLDCPYPDLASRDRGICAVERMLFAKLLDAPVRLSQCRLDGHSCCQFETN